MAGKLLSQYDHCDKGKKKVAVGPQRVQKTPGGKRCARKLRKRRGGGNRSVPNGRGRVSRYEMRGASNNTTGKKKPLRTLEEKVSTRLNPSLQKI